MPTSSFSISVLLLQSLHQGEYIMYKVVQQSLHHGEYTMYRVAGFITR